MDQADGTINRALDEKTPLTAHWEPGLLEGVEVIKGKFTDGTDLTAIPYYARLNRGGRSLVWMQDGDATAH